GRAPARRADAPQSTPARRVRSRAVRPKSPISPGSARRAARCPDRLRRRGRGSRAPFYNRCMLSAFLAVLIAVGPIQLTFTTAVSAPTAKPGQALKLFVDVTPKPKMHVYAPGAKGYLPIVLELKSAGGRAGMLAYPMAQAWYFDPTMDHVP